MWTTENRHRYNRDRLRYPSDLTDAEWQLIEPLIPPAKRGGGQRTVVMREVVNGVMYVLSTGCQWRYVPKDLPPRSTVNGYFCQWSWDGTLKRIHDALYIKCREQAEREISPTACVIDSQSVKSAEKRLSWLSSIVLVSDDLTRRGPAQGWRAGPPPSAAAASLHPVPCQLGF
jgi:transposase